MTIRETGRHALETGPVCDSCLGRPFAQRSHGLTNSERGQAIRIMTALEDDIPYESVDPVNCWVCEGYSGYFDALAELIVEQLSTIEFRTYQVGSKVPALIEENDRLLRIDSGLEPDVGESVSREINREVGRKVGANFDADVSFERPDVLIIIDLAAFDPLNNDTVTEHAIDVQINSAFVYGRYRKLKRDIPQTEWPCSDCGGSGETLGADGIESCEGCDGSGYRYQTSVEQVIRPHVVEAMDGGEGIFHGAGREDVDAKMLGTGRPFVLEVHRPKIRYPDVGALERMINTAEDGVVEVDGLQLATYEMVERVKSLEASKRYRAAVKFDTPVTDAEFQDAIETLSNSSIDQYTPHRVDHRRANRTRNRRVYAMDGELSSDTEAVVEIHGEGGLYVKELISGDEGRTEPSLAAELETGAVVTELDVLDVTGESEAFARPKYLLSQD